MTEAKELAERLESHAFAIELKTRPLCHADLRKAAALILSQAERIEKATTIIGEFIDAGDLELPLYDDKSKDGDLIKRAREFWKESGRPG